jgi:hypothetical protein
MSGQHGFKSIHLHLEVWVRYRRSIANRSGHGFLDDCRLRPYLFLCEKHSCSCLENGIFRFTRKLDGRHVAFSSVIRIAPAEPQQARCGCQQDVVGLCHINGFEFLEVLFGLVEFAAIDQGKRAIV